MQRAGLAVQVTFLMGITACLSAADLSGGGNRGELPPGVTVDGDGGICAADLKTSIANCGACGNFCGNQLNAYGFCKDGACAIGCNTGFGDCDGKVETGCESVLATDSNHCGACGKSCGGARCVAGQCQPLSIGEIPGYTFGFAQDATDLYYVFSGGGANYAVAKLAKDGSKGHTEVVTGVSQYTTSLAVTDTQVYWARSSDSPVAQPANGGIYRASKTGASVAGAAWIGALRLSYGDSFVVSEGSAFYVTTEASVSTVSRAAVTGMAGTAVAQGIKGSVNTLAVDGALAYFYANGDNTGLGRGMYQCATSGCGTSITPIAGVPANTYVRKIVGGLPHLYISTYQAIARLKKDGTEYAVLGVGDNSNADILSFAVDGTRLVWIERTFGGGPGNDEFFTWSCPVANCKDNRASLTVPGEPLSVLSDNAAFYIFTRTSNGTGTQTTVLKVVK